MKLRARQLLEIAAIMAAVGVIFGVLFFLLFDSSYRVLETAVKARSQASISAVAASVNFALASGDKDDAKAQLTRFMRRHPEARGVALVDAKGKPFATQGRLQSLARPKLEGTKTYSRLVSDGSGGRLVRAATAVLAEDTVVGWVVYEESISSVLGYRKTMATMALLGSALLVFMIPVVGFFSFRRVLGGLSSLSRATEQAQQGDLAVRVPVVGKDELAALAERFNEMLAELDHSRREQRQRERLQREFELAESIQTSLLPPLRPINGLRIAARMLTAEEVGGDYYDVLPTDDNHCWVAIGDVAGHGLSAGLVMMMVQSAIATATARDPKASPSEILALVNKVVHGNVRGRWGASQHMTLTLMRYRGGGKFVYAGAHEDLIIWRQKEAKVELLPTRGTWIGAIADVSRVMWDAELELGVGDRLVLFTDGVIEAMGDDHEQFGVERLVDAVEGSSNIEPYEVVDHVLGAVKEFTPDRFDDQTLVVVERTEGMDG